MQRLITSGVRFRLFALVLGIALPLAFVGFFAIQKIWETSRHQLNESVQKQAELTAATYEQWVEAQREVLAVFSTYPGRQRKQEDIFAMADSIVTSRSHWVGLHILGSNGEPLLSRPSNAPPLPEAIIGNLLKQLQDKPVAVKTDWTGDGLLIIAAPNQEGGAVVAQVNLVAMSESLFPEYKLPEQAVLALMGSQRRILLYRTQSPDSRLGMDLSDSPVFGLLDNRSATVVELQSPIDGVQRVYGLARASNTGTIIMVGIPSHTLYEPARQQMNRFLAFSIVAVVLALLGAVLIARSIAGPIRKLSWATRSFGQGELQTRASFQASGEIEELRTAFNAMASQIEEREARLTELDHLKSDFVSGVSHELRTPLTTIKTLTRVLLRSESDNERREYLETISAECDRQIDLVLNLLDLSRIESKTFNFSLTCVDVIEVIKNCVIIERHSAEAHRQQLLADLPEKSLLVCTDRTALRRILCSILENAIKYTSRGGHITLSAHTEAGYTHIQIEDTGSGIYAGDLPHIFDKFYRGQHVVVSRGYISQGEETEQVEVPGVGLGLYLAKSIVEDIGGRIRVASTPGIGSIFTISLPTWDYENGNQHSENSEV
jgi:signal transduction histidine kinase